MASQEYKEALKNLEDKIEALSYVQDFKKIEKKIKSSTDVWEREKEMKAMQKDAIFFQRIEKNNAYQSLMDESRILEEELNSNPLVIQYRKKLQDVSDLLQYVTWELEEKINISLQSDDREEI